MNSKVIVIVGALAAVVAVGAVITGKKGEETTQITAPSEELLPALDKRVNEAARIHIEDATTSLTLSRAEGIWRLEQSANYPANYTSVSQLVLSLSQLKKVEAKTANKELYERLEVEDMSASAKGKLITVSDDKGAEIASVIIGKSWFPPGGTGQNQYRYARATDDKQSWLVSGNLNIVTTKQGWLSTEVLAVPATRFQSVEVVQEDGEKVVISKEKETDTNYKLETLPLLRELTSDSRPNELAGAFASVRFDEVLPATKIEGLTPIATLTARSFDGLVVEAKTFRAEGDLWSTFAASVDEARIEAVNTERKNETDKQNEENKDVQDYTPVTPQTVNVEDIRKEADAINKKAAAWAYKIPSYMQERLQRRNEYFLKAMTEEEKIGGPVPMTGDSETTPTEGLVPPPPSGE